MVRFRIFTFLTVCFLILATVSIATFATSPHSIEATQSIDTPTKTFTISGDEYSVSSLGYVDQGNDLSYSVTAGNASVFTVHLYNSEKQIEASQRHTANGTYSFGTGYLSPGTYILALSIDGSIKAIHPVVVSGYEFSIDAPSTVPENESVSITIKLTSTSGTPSRVEIAVLNETVQQNYIATRVDDRTYNVIISDLSPGDYRLYAGTRGTDEIDGEDELTGISSVHTLTITSESQSTPTQTPSDTSSQSQTATSTESGSQSRTTTSSDSTSPNTQPGTNTTKTPVTTAVPTTTIQTPPATTSASTSATPATTSTDRPETPGTPTPIQPANATPSTTVTTAPGFTIFHVILGGLVILFLWYRDDR